MVLSSIEQGIKAKIENVGTPLRDWDVNIYRGILTGYNEAFIIDTLTKEKLIAESPKSAEIIRPILLGKDVKRYKYDWKNLWIIFTKRGINIEDYSAIKNHLNLYYKQLRPRNNNEVIGRKPGTYKWFEIQDNVAYYKDFEKGKIVWGNLALRSQFSYVSPGYYINAPSAFIATDNLYLLAVLNSKIGDYYIRHLGVARNGGYIEYKPMFVEQLPIPRLNDEEQKPFIKLVDTIIKNKLADGELTKIENKIDEMVYALYNIEPNEVDTVNNHLANII